jgi:peptide/nickel transport system substrate-binding protein
MHSDPLAYRPWRWLALIVPLLPLLLGCGGCFAPPSTPAGANGDDETAATAPFKFADLVEPFTPPSLEELESQVTWIDRPVKNSLEMLRAKLAAEVPLATVPEALALRNDSEEANAKILSALGRLPQDDTEVNFGAAINRHTYGDVNTVNPLLMSSTTEFDVNSLIGFGLFSFDWNFENFAAAESVVSWQSSEDRLYDKVVMRKDLTWSDGAPITAHDIVFSFQTILTRAVPVPAMRSGTDKLKWVEAYDDHTVVFFHKESLVVNDSNINFSVIPKHVYEKHLEEDPTLARHPHHVALENKPVVGGVYEITSRTRGQEIILTARESYYMHEGKQVRDRPHFQTVRFRIRPNESVALLALKAGDIDEMQLSPQLWETQTNNDDFYQANTKVRGVEWLEFHFLWNEKEPFFRDKRVRQAMSYAMDYDELLQRLRYGLDEPCNGVFHPTAKWYPSKELPFYQQDLAKAEQLLEEAGWVDSDGDGIRDKVVDGRKVKFEFTMLTVNKPDRVDICTLMKESLDQIQVRCNVRPLDFPVVIDNMQKRTFQAAFGGWGTGTDPYTLENIFGTGKERNYTGYSNQKVDELFQEGLREFDEQKRIAIYQQIHEILYEDQPYTWLFYQTSFYGFNKSLRGYNWSPRGPYHYGPGFSALWKPAAP